MIGGMSPQTADVLFGCGTDDFGLGELEGLARRILQAAEPGWAFRVLRDAPVVPPTPELVWDMPCPDWVLDGDYTVPDA